jgi:hypothetical protein
VIVNGERVKLADLKAGDPITIWVAETRFAFYASPGKGSYRRSNSSELGRAHRGGNPTARGRFAAAVDTPT